MKNSLLIPAIILALSACNSQNKEDKQSSVVEKKEVLSKHDDKLKEPVYPIVDNRFDKLKLVTLELLSKREAVLKQEKQCVNKAKTREEIKSCLSEASEARKTVGEELKKKKEEQKTVDKK